MKKLYTTELPVNQSLTNLAKHELINGLKEYISNTGKYILFFSFYSKGNFIITPDMKEFNLVIKSNFQLPKTILHKVNAYLQGYLFMYQISIRK